MAVFSGNGSAASPSFTFSGDTDSGMYLSAADTVAFAAGGTEAFTIDTSGTALFAGMTSAGIGTVSYNRADSGSYVDGVVYTAASGTSAITINAGGGSASVPSTLRQAFISWDGRGWFSDSVAVGDQGIGGTLGDNPNISLNSDGSSSFLGTIVTGSASVGVVVDPLGRVEARRDSTSGVANVFNGFGGSGGSTNIFRVSAGGTTYTVGGSVSNISSERRLKDNIVLLDEETCWDTVKDLKYYEYEYKSMPGTKRYGPIVDECPSEMVIDTDLSDEEGTIRTYDNGMLQARLYVALQTALTRIEELEARLDAAGV